MKCVAFLLLLLWLLLPLRADQDILINSNFSDGHSHWEGDAKDVDTGDLTSDTQTAGAVIHLKKDKWTKIYQLFTVRNKKLYYTVSFQLSNDFKIAPRSEGDYSRADLGDVPGLMYQAQMSESSFTLMIRGGENFTQTSLNPDVSKLGKSQTLTGRVNPYVIDVESVFLIVFPPGQGTVTLTQASLSSTDPNAQP
jgi:hypothetical protein